jgi:predicted GNAT family acetyltransferase
MNLNPLDNPVWHALNSHHHRFAIRGEVAARYRPDVSLAAAMPENSPSAFSDLQSLVEMNETIGVIGGVLPEDLPGWQVLHIGQVRQLICADLKPATRVEAVVLTEEDVPEMLDLVNLAQPGPFFSRTAEMGQYLGLRQEGHLVAMAGERFHLTGFCEVSAVCTHPDYRGRGYGGALTTMVSEGILERQETPFLHVAPGNDPALSLYIKLGFRIRTEIQVSVLQKLAT